MFAAAAHRAVACLSRSWSIIRRDFAAAASRLELTRLERPTPSEFLDLRRRSPGVPFLITGALDDLGWAMSRWSPKDLRDRFGDVEVPLEVWLRRRRA